MQAFYEIVDSTSYRVFYDLTTKRLIMPSEFRADPATQYVTVLTGPLPNPELHDLVLNEVVICYYNLNLRKDGLILKDPYFQWYQKFSTSPLLELVQNYLQLSSTLKMRVSARLLGKALNVNLLTKAYKELSQLSTTLSEVELRKSPDAKDLVRKISNLLIEEALQ